MGDDDDEDEEDDDNDVAQHRKSPKPAVSSPGKRRIGFI